MIKSFGKFINDGKPNNEKGSALITVLIIISLLTILGLGLMMVSVSGLKRSLQLSGANNAFYITDGAIEESLAEINDMSFEAERLANEHINAVVSIDEENIFDAFENKEDTSEEEETFVQVEVWQDFLRKLKSDLHNGVLTEEEVMDHIDRALNLEFLVKYYEYFLNQSDILSYTLIDEKTGDYLGQLDTQSSYKENCLTYTEIDQNALKKSTNPNNTTAPQNRLVHVELNQHIENVSGYDTTSDEADENLDIEVVNSSFKNRKLYITLKSNGRYNEHKKAVQLKVEIEEPQYQFVFRTAKGVERIKHNEILDYAMASGKDLIVTEGSVTIEGNAYFYGTIPEKNSPNDRLSQKDFGGIVLGIEEGEDDFLRNDLSGFKFYSMLDHGTETWGSAKLDVKGDLYTRGNLKFFKSGYNLMVENDLGANEVRTESSIDNTGIINIDVFNNLYLFEDIILRGDKATTNIRVGTSANMSQDLIQDKKGELYLMLDSGDTNYDQGDLAGSIVVDRGAADKSSIEVDKAFIHGVSFSGIARKDEDGNIHNYMTGESLTTENKYLKFYTTAYAKNERNGQYAGKLSGYDEVDYYYGYDADGNPLYEDTPYEMLEKSSDDEETNDKEFKKQVFVYGAQNGDPNAPASRVDEEDKSIFKIRSVNERFDFLNDNYTAGIVPGKTNDDTMVLFGTDKANDMSVWLSQIKREVLNTKDRDVDKKMNLLATRDIKNGLNYVYEYEEPTGSNATLVSIDEKTQGTRLSQLIRMDQTTRRYNLESNSNIQIINDDASKDIYINPPGLIGDENIAIGGLGDVKANLSGIIATKGDVYIYAPSGVTVTFEGNIYAEGRVIFYGPGSKKIVDKVIDGDIKLSHQLVAAYDSLNAAFYTQEGRMVENIYGHYDGESDYLEDYDGERTSDTAFTTDLGNQPVIVVVPFKRTNIVNIDVDLSQLPLLVGMQKNKGVQRYKVEYWREVRD